MKYPRTQIPKYPNGGDYALGEEELWGFAAGAMELRDAVTLTKPYDLEERTAQFGEATRQMHLNGRECGSRGCGAAQGELGSARASRAAVDAPVHRADARHRATIQIERKDDARWRASVLTARARSGTREARVVPVQERHIGTASGSPVGFDAAALGEAIVRFAKKIPESAVNYRLIGQLVGAGTSVGANYCEADDGVSRKDYKVRIGTCKKEARETKFFLRMIAVADESLKPEARVLWQEARELHLIFAAIYRKQK